MGVDTMNVKYLENSMRVYLENQTKFSDCSADECEKGPSENEYKYILPGKVVPHSFRARLHTLNGIGRLYVVMEKSEELQETTVQKLRIGFD
ncbi:hypothetical protein SARC_13331 [Sphaeroforma arctica JP610]|uniref:Uncharacterized protein n=1 Tax=Sphaeroforma arctica JP610 TaxID=667725 RepID=A0A0L0FCD5_9EUKA|nr:hypothetical protein SARC_13331 [Sphaeroforma arctica JP610]KNC74111.1 hypothetical protein SARC_13331 [Sphaeroforma arctica JP610]|eukprot:XP_014148013.1 hypothetical protein SARC_13331 [Sphaeroforma arctica JP610]